MEQHIPFVVLRCVGSGQMAIQPIAGHEQRPHAAKRVQERTVGPGRHVHREGQIVEQERPMQGRSIHLKGGEYANHQPDRPKPEFGLGLLLGGAFLFELFRFHSFP